VLGPSRDPAPAGENGAFKSVVPGVECMTTVAVVTDPPWPGTVLPDLVPGVVTPAEAADLYAAMLRDVCLALDASGAEFLINYRPADLLPSADPEADATLNPDPDPETAIRNAIEPALDPSTVRFERQVGSTRSARIGNTVTHLLESEGAKTAAVVPPTAAFVARRHVDGAAMKLRGSEVVLGPAPGGRLHYAGFAEPIDFESAVESAPLTTVTARAREADLDVDFLELLPLLESPADLSTALSTLAARWLADQPVPGETAAVVDDLGLEAASDSSA